VAFGVQVIIKTTAKGLSTLKNIKAMKQDRREVARKQRHEINYIVYKWGIPKETVEDVVWNVGKSRVLIYEVLRRLGFVIPGKFDKRLKKKLKEVLERMGRATN
jgi:hypothetical protein